MTSFKKILPTFLKILIGVFSLAIIFNKLSQTPELKSHFISILADSKVYTVILIIILLMPINWGIESFKWKLCTAQIEHVSYKTALKSVFTGICLGNLAPGRAMEFVAKIYFFKPDNRPTITILHFINGMFQMLITVVVGLISIAYKLTEHETSNNIVYGIIIGGIGLILFFCWAILNVSFIQKKLKFIKWFDKAGNDDVKFSLSLIFNLIGLSIVRYLVFTLQFYLIYSTLNPNHQMLAALTSIAAYFIITSLVPMISFIEPAIRAAIALFVFNNAHENSVTIILCATILWLINVVVPSIIGYIIILREKIDFKSPHAN